MESVWETRDLPVLQALVEHFDAIDAGQLTAERVAVLADMPEDAVKRALRDLGQAVPRLIDGTVVDLAPYPIVVHGVTERGRRLAGAWPDPHQLGERLAAELERTIEAEPDEAKRTRLRRAFEALGGITREVFVQVAANAIGGTSS